MDKEQIEAINAVLQQMMEATGAPNLSKLAKLAGLSHTTLTRQASSGSGDGKPEVTWELSTKTWMKLSAASGVPVTFLGEQIIVSGPQPGDRNIIKQPVPLRLLQFWGMLGPDERALVMSIVDAWAERIVGRGKGE